MRGTVDAESARQSDWSSRSRSVWTLEVIVVNRIFDKVPAIAALLSFLLQVLSCETTSINLKNFHNSLKYLK